MPRVPTYDSFQATPNTLPQARLVVSDMPDVAGQQAQQMGRAMQMAGSELGKIALDMQQQVNQARIEELRKANQARIDEWQIEAIKARTQLAIEALQQQGRNALERPDGKSLADEYTAKLDAQLKQLTSGLGNEAQRQAAAHISAQMQQQFYGLVSQHMLQQQRHFEQQQEADTVSVATQQGVALWGIPALLEQSKRAIQSVLDKTIARNGWDQNRDAAQITAARQKLFTPLHSGVIESMLQGGKVGEAAEYLNRHADQIDTGHLVKLNQLVNQQGDLYIGSAVANDIMGTIQSRIRPNDAERAFNILLGAESNYRQFDNSGKPLTSPKGAIGIAQVMPDTAPEAAKLAGLPWDENRYKNDAEYNKALGFAYFQQMLRQNGGDLAKAFAAYNAGQGRLEKAIKKAEMSARLAQNDPSIRQYTWLDFMPEETRNYVAKNMQAYESGQGQRSRPTFDEIDAQLRADPRIAGNPSRYKIARQEAERQFNEQLKAIKQRDEEAVATAMRGIIENGGRFSDLPVSVRAAVPPKEVDNLISFAQKIAKGDDSTSLWLYAKLASNPDALARMSDDEFFALRRELSEADFKHFANERAKRNGNSAGVNGPGDLNSQAIKQSLDQRLRMLQIDPSPKDDGGSEAARVGAIRRFVDQYFMAAQREAGRKFTDAEVSQHLDALFATNATFRGWFSTSSGPMLTMKVSDIDSATKDGIKAAFKRQGIDNPTDAQILNAYWNMKVTRK